MKFQLIILFSCLSYFTYGQTTDLLDENFELALIEFGLDYILDGEVLTGNIDTLTTLDVSDRMISDLTGIEDFLALEHLDCSTNDLTVLDVSLLSNLRYLSIQANDISEIDVTSQYLLDTLFVSGNNLSTLNLSGNPELSFLSCSSNSLTELDLSGAPLIRKLFCTGNSINDLNLSGAAVLEDLYCSGNNLTELDLSELVNLITLFCGDNFITSLDLSNNPELENLVCSNLDLTELDVSSNPQLEILSASFTAISTIDLSNNLSLEWLTMIQNELEVLDLRANTALIELRLINSPELKYILMDNGNNTGIPDFGFEVTNSPNLMCIQVDDEAFSESTWFSIDDSDVFSELCSIASVNQEGAHLDREVFTNPQTGEIVVVAEQDLKYNLYAISGKQIHSGNLLKGTNQIAKLPVEKGVYLLELISPNGQREVKKVILN